jgi:hypothetical protein
MKKYWHEIPEDEMKTLLSKPLTESYVLDNYLQPDWCEYPEALRGLMGCWSLTGNNRIHIGLDFCKKCDCFIAEKNKK